MDIKDAINDHVLRRLEDTFGKAMTLMILASATRVAGCSTIDPDREDFLRIVEAICTDRRVIDMWGEAGSQATLAMWRALV